MNDPVIQDLSDPDFGRNAEIKWDGVPEEAFMIIVFDEDAVRGNGGVIRYRAEFDQAM
jgi:predicted N-acetyltransferase YhbS